MYQLKDNQKESTKIHLKSYFVLPFQLISRKIYMGFPKDRVKWKYSMVNNQ